MIESISTYSIRQGKPMNSGDEHVVYLDVRALKGPKKSLRDTGKTGVNKDVYDDILKRPDNVETLLHLQDSATIG